MNFGQPHYLFIAWSGSFVVGVFYLWAMRRRSILMRRFVDKALLKDMAPGASAGKKFLKVAMVVTAIVAGLVSLARPQWGVEWEEVKRVGLDILIAVDVSKSMMATDVKPNRLERTKYAVKDLIKKLNGDRVGLIAFAGTAFLQCPLTIDYNGLLLALDDLTCGTIPRGGTSIASAIREAIDVYKGPEKKYKVLMVITDGEELEGDALSAANDAAKSGIKIYCVGVGTREGDLIPEIDEAGLRGYVTDRAGNVVKTALREDLLKQAALSTGGSYVKASQSDFGLTLLYDNGISKLEKRDIESKMRKQYQERFQLFLAAAFALLAIEPLIAERRRVIER